MEPKMGRKKNKQKTKNESDGLSGGHSDVTPSERARPRGFETP